MGLASHGATCNCDGVPRTAFVLESMVSESSTPRLFILHPKVALVRMVLIESVGFGVRDRDLFLYFWDLRDGADWSGWWVTPDFCGNNDYILQAQSDCADPSDVGVGDWRWPRTPSNLTPEAQA